MILVCAVDYFREEMENVKNELFSKNHKKDINKQKFRGLVFFKLARRV